MAAKPKFVCSGIMRMKKQGTGVVKFQQWWHYTSDKNKGEWRYLDLVPYTASDTERIYVPPKLEIHEQAELPDIKTLKEEQAEAAKIDAEAE